MRRVFKISVSIRGNIPCRTSCLTKATPQGEKFILSRSFNTVLFFVLNVAAPNSNGPYLANKIHINKFD